MWQEALRSLLYPGVLYIVLISLLFEWVDRKLVARFQNRVGPRYAGPFGLLQPLADILKLLSKEDIVPEGTDNLLFTASPIAALVATLVAASFLPMDGPVGLVSFDCDLVVAIALLIFCAFTVYAAGVAPPSRYSLIGAERGVLMLIGFEIPLMLACLDVARAARSLRISDIVLAQREHFYALGYHAIAFAMFLIAAQAELERIPFDIPEAETEIVAGWSVEYASWRLAFFRLARDVETAFISGLGATLFLGGPLGPAPPELSWLLYPLYFLLKSMLILALLSLLRALFARVRVDQFESICWRYLVPASIVYFVASLWVA